MGGGGNILLAVGKAGIGGKAGAEFHKIADGAGVDFYGPRSFAGVVEEIGAKGVDALCRLQDGVALVALGHKFEAVAERARGKGAEEGLAEGGGDEGGEGFRGGGGLGQGA